MDTARHRAPILTDRLGPTFIEGTIIDRADRGGVARAVLADLVIHDLTADLTPKRVRIRLAGQDMLRPGQRIRVRAVLTPADGPVMPGAFDFRRWAYFQKLGAFGFSIGTAEIISESNSGNGASRMESIRFRIGEKITQTIPGQAGAIAKALLTGERGDITNRTSESLRIAGLAHLLAISGLHVGLVAGLVFLAVRSILAASLFAAQVWPIKKISAAAALMACLSYVILVGAPVPTQRAFVMALIVLVAVML